MVYLLEGILCILSRQNLGPRTSRFQMYTMQIIGAQEVSQIGTDALYERTRRTDS